MASNERDDKKKHYITLANNFWEACIEGVSSNEVHLYFRLLFICNRLSWKNPFGYKDASLYGEIGMTNKTFQKARQSLQDRQLIKYRQGHKGVNSVYELVFIDRKGYHLTNGLIGNIPTNSRSEVKNEGECVGELEGECVGNIPNYNNTDTDTDTNILKRERKGLLKDEIQFFEMYMKTYQGFYKQKKGANYEFHARDNSPFKKIIEALKKDIKDQSGMTERNEYNRLVIFLLSAYYDTEVPDAKYSFKSDFSPANLHHNINTILPNYKKRLKWQQETYEQEKTEAEKNNEPIPNVNLYEGPLNRLQASANRY